MGPLILQMIHSILRLQVNYFLNHIKIYTLLTFFLASKVLQTLQKEAKRKALGLTVSISDKLPGIVKGNSNNLKQLIVYFTSNAFKHSTVVKVELNLIRTKDGISTIELQVQDFGPGMSEEELDVF